VTPNVALTKAESTPVVVALHESTEKPAMPVPSDSPVAQTEVVTSPTNMRVLEWVGETDGTLRLLDQTLLPCETKTLDCQSVEQVVEAIRTLRVRGAPAIGVAAAYGVVIGARETANAERPKFDERLQAVVQQLAASRPTAVNLFWALDRQRRLAERMPAATPRDVLAALLAEARVIEAEDRAMCAAIGRYGAELLNAGDAVLTHCNAGALATAGDGTALAVIYAAAANGKKIRVFADETRPLLQGARLTAWELSQRGIPVTVICDSMAATVMRQRKVQAVIVGADRIAANGDTANKIGTYSVACLAKTHGIPFYVAAPSSTFDLSLSNGDLIPIEERSAAEITHGFGRQTAPDGIDVYNPAFDITPAELITAIITERGVIQPVTREMIITCTAQNPP
jgi:methylthioribose-1-phosphate isomerase